MASHRVGRNRIHKTFGKARASFLRRRIRNRCAGGPTATVAGHTGPGFHHWPSGHIPQDTDLKSRIRSRSSAQKTFGKAFGAATGVSEPGYRGEGDREAVTMRGGGVLAQRGSIRQGMANGGP